MLLVTVAVHKKGIYSHVSLLYSWYFIFQSKLLPRPRVTTSLTSPSTCHSLNIRHQPSHVILKGPHQPQNFLPPPLSHMGRHQILGPQPRGEDHNKVHSATWTNDKSVLDGEFQTTNFINQFSSTSLFLF